MPSEQVQKLSRYGWLTVAALVLFGGIRLVIHVVGVVRYAGTDDAERRAEYMKHCRGIFAEGDRYLSEDTDIPLSAVAPQGRTICQIWVEEGLKVRDRFLVWHMTLWAVAGLLSIATLLVAFLVLKRNANAAKWMCAVFVVQLLSFVGESAKAMFEGMALEKAILPLRSDIDLSGPGFIILSSDTVGKIVAYAILGLFYAGLYRNVRSEKIWNERQTLS